MVHLQDFLAVAIKHRQPCHEDLAHVFDMLVERRHNKGHYIPAAMQHTNLMPLLIKCHPILDSGLQTLYA